MGGKESKEVKTDSSSSVSASGSKVASPPRSKSPASVGGGDASGDDDVQVAPALPDGTSKSKTSSKQQSSKDRRSSSRKPVNDDEGEDLASVLEAAERAASGGAAPKKKESGGSRADKADKKQKALKKRRSSSKRGIEVNGGDLADAGAPLASSPSAKRVQQEVAEIEAQGVGDGEVIFQRDPNQKVTRDDFELLTLIGKGSFGKVMQVKLKTTGEIFAMKVLRKEAIIARKQVTHTKSEKTVLQKVQHPFIVKLHFAFQTKEKLYMILDYINGGELFFHLKREGRFDEERVRYYAAEIVSAISHLHSLGVIYRDLKPENILIDRQGFVVITDFGLSKEIEPEEGTHTFCGTPEYLAPEVLKGQGHGMGVDWWSLGTLLYEMLTGLPPFFSQNINIMYTKILNGELKFPPHVSPEAQSLLRGFLTRDVDKRLGSPSSGGEQKIKDHEFFEGIDWELLDKRELTPPWIPPVTTETDTTLIDSVFTQEKPTDSDDEENDQEGELNFDGFTFQGDSHMSKR